MLYPTKQIVASLGVTRETFMQWSVPVAEKRGRSNYYRLADVVENRLQHRESVVRAEYDRKRRRNGWEPPVEHDFAEEVREELSEWVSKEMFPRLWNHPDMWAGVMGFAVEEQKLSVEAAWQVFAFTMVQMVGAVADGFQKDREEFECKMPDWFDELAELGKGKFLAKRWPQIEKLNAEWQRRKELRGQSRKT